MRNAVLAVYPLRFDERYRLTGVRNGTAGYRRIPNQRAQLNLYDWRFERNHRFAERKRIKLESDPKGELARFRRNKGPNDLPAIAERSPPMPGYNQRCTRADENGSIGGVARVRVGLVRKGDRHKLSRHVFQVLQGYEC